MILFLFLCWEDIQCKFKKNDLIIIFALFSLLLPSFAIIFGALEERYLILLYMIAFGRISDYQVKSNIGFKTVLFKYVLALFIALTALSIESGILSCLQGSESFIPLLFTGKR